MERSGLAGAFKIDFKRSPATQTGMVPKIIPTPSLNPTSQKNSSKK